MVIFNKTRFKINEPKSENLSAGRKRKSLTMYGGDKKCGFYAFLFTVNS